MKCYYCPHCNDTCLYMELVSEITSSQPYDTNGKIVGGVREMSNKQIGAKCLLCGHSLKYEPEYYVVDLTKVDGKEYIESYAIWEIHNHENSSNG